MTKKDLVKIIREVVKREVKSQVNIVLTEMENNSTGKLSINEAIKQTSTDYPTLKEFTSADARAGFAAMQTGHGAAGPQTDLSGKVVDVATLDPSLQKALTKDYSQLVKKMVK